MSRWSFVPPVIALTSLLPLTAAAQPHQGPADLGNPDVHVDLQAYVDENPPELPIKDDQRPHQLGDKVVFVNFDGADMNGGCGNNPANNCSTIFTGVVEPFFGDAAARAAIVQWTRDRTDPFGISFTDTRPTSGDYDMEMVGKWQGQDNGSTAGVAPGIDCWDNSGGQTSFTMLSGNAEAVGEVIVQEIAHTWGLAHINDTSDLLYPTTEGQNKEFVDQCFQIVSNTKLDPSSSGCSHHQQACGSNSQQNSYQELLLIFGPGTADTTAPTTAILEPADGEMFPSGSNVNVRIALDDNQTPMLFTTRVTVESPAIGDPVESIADYAGPAEYDFPLKGLPDGAYTVTLEVSDEEDNMAPNQSVSFTVGNAGGSSGGNTTDDSSSGGTTTDGSGGSSSDSSSGGTDGSSGGSDTSDPSTGSATGASGTSGEGMMEDDGGCACSAETGRDRATWAFLPLLLGFVRRRRS